MRALLVTGVLALAACAPMQSDPSLATGQLAEVQRRADLRLQLATAYYAEGQYSTALHELDLAYQTGQRRAEVLGLRSLVLMQQGDTDGATRSLRLALQLEPDNPGLLNNMGWLLCETGHAHEGLNYFSRVLANKTYQYPARAMVNAGRCSLSLGKRAQAEAFFLQALATDPGLFAAHTGLARLAYEAGDYARARSHLLRVLPSNQALKEDFLMAISIERKLGDKMAAQTLIQQWRKRFPDAVGADNSAGNLSIIDADEQ